MDSGTAEWWRRHGWTIALLLVAFGFAFSVRTIWNFPIVAKWGALYTYAGGSDSYYHSRVMAYIVTTHHNLVHDPMLKFPVGATNPREPLFDWMNAVFGILFSPFFSSSALCSSACNAGAWFLELQGPLWAALGVFPIYLIGREASGRRTGLIAALIYPFFTASIDSSTFGYANYLSFYTFMLLIVVYSYLRTVKAVGHRRWVESYRQPRQILDGLRGMWRSERTSIKWAVFTGVAMGAFALSWQGYTYAIVVVIFTLIVAMLIERIRRVDSFSLYVVTWIIALIGLGMSAPYYIVQHQLRAFLELPIILLFGSLALLLPFLLMRDVPWVFSIPALLAVIVGGVLALRFLTPTLFTAAVTGDGYFVKNLIYTTVAEAQAPSFDALVIGYGVITFFAAFAGLALFAYQTVHNRFKRYHIGFLVFAIVSVYLPISASKFFLVGAPAYAILAGEALHRMIDVGGYPQLRRSVASLTDRTSSFAAFRKSFKARHVLVLALVVGVILPNVWIAIDAGIPSNSKSQLAQEINHTIPSWLKLNSSAPASSYLGAAGSGLDTPDQYDSAAYNWLARQDTGTPEPQRPAFVSWWDYGFQAIDQGQHPSVADNFQNGIDPAGQFLLSQNESLAISVLITALLQGEITLTHQHNLPASLNGVLAGDGVNLTQLHHDLNSGAADYHAVVSHPRTYLPVNRGTLTYDNAVYLVTSYFLASHLSLSKVARVYDDVESYTGWSIRYGMTDTRLFPFSGQDTGIFYAPADLTGRVINSVGVPTTYYNISILGSDGTTYPLGPLPAGVGATQYNINWSTPFYRTMLYRTYIGYNGTDVGQKSGIPGLSGAATSDPIEPAWMLQHFEVEYRTAYVCPGNPKAPPNSGCFHATNRPNAIALANSTNGSDNLSAFRYFQGGEAILAYYPGVTLQGRVVLPSGAPVPGLRVTVDDGWGIPHMTNVTDANGSFSLILPPGNDTLNLTAGTFDAMNQSDANLVAHVRMPISNALGFNPQAPTLVQTFTVNNASVNGLVFWNVTGNKTYVPGKDPIVRGGIVTLTSAAGTVAARARTDPSGAFRVANVAPGEYSVGVDVNGVNYTAPSTYIAPGQTHSLNVSLAPGSVSGSVYRITKVTYTGATVSIANTSSIVASAVTNVSGGFQFTGLAPGTYTLSAVGYLPTSTSDRVTVKVGEGQSAQANLTIAPRGSALVAVSVGGSPVANASVTFTPAVAFGAGPLSPTEALLKASTNTTSARTNAQGVAAARLAVGVYSVEAVGRIGGVSYEGLGLLNVTNPGVSVSTVVNLTTERTVTVTPRHPASSANRTGVLAYASSGAELIGWSVPTNGTISLPLPDGRYSLLTVSGPTTASSTASSDLTVLNVTGSTNLLVNLGPSVHVRWTVGTTTSGGTLIPAGNASVMLDAAPGGPVLHANADPNGSVGFVLPESLGPSSGGYCVSTSAFGFVANGSCGLSPSELVGMTKLPLAVRPVAVTLRVDGLPAKTTVTVNITGESAGATTVSRTGLSPFAFSLPPGTYGVGARAVIGNGSTVYLPSSVLSTRIPLGARYSNLTLIVVPEINASGKLTLPSGVSAASTKVSLTSPLLNLNLTGTQYTSSFRATPANYTATVTATLAGVKFVNVTRISVAADGTIRPRLVLSEQGVAFNATLTQPSGAKLVVNATVKLVSAAGLAIRERAVDGVVSGTLPPGTYRVFANATATTSGPNGTFSSLWTTEAGAACTFSVNQTRCSVPASSVALPVTVGGVIVAGGGTTPVPASLRIVGPYPSRALSLASAPNGTFGLSLAPGSYNVYAVSTASPHLAGLFRVLALPGAVSEVRLALVPTWTATLPLSLQNVSGETSGLATILVRNAVGAFTEFTGIAPGTTVAVALPLGNYSVSANANGSRNGVSSPATASASVVLANGNVVVPLTLVVRPLESVTASLGGPLSASVAPGGQASFTFTVRSTGNVPVTITPSGSPSPWTFNFSFSSLRLAPGASAGESVRITVPKGADVQHPALVIAFTLANGTQVGSVSPAPVVNVLPTYGIASGTSSKSPPRVGPSNAVLPFFLRNRGNTNESVRLSVVDVAKLASYGWTVGWLVSNKTVTSTLVNLSAGENLTAALNLTATSTSAVSPGSVAVVATVTNRGVTASSTVTLNVPRPSLRLGPGSLTVTGPRVASGPPAIPTWVVPLLAFVPTLALIGLVVTYRWWRTRRWTRR